MAWVEFHGSRIKRLKKFSDFRKTLNWSVNEALGFLGSFWGEVIELAEDGDITGWTPEYLCDLTGVTLSPDKLWGALVAYNWIDVGSDMVLVHDWIDSAGLFLTRKYGSSNRQLLHDIWEKYGRVYGDSERLVNKKRTISEHTIPNLTIPNQPNQPKRIHPPSLEDAKAYFKDKGRTPEQAEKFWNYYESNGWMAGRNPMKNWEAAASGWILRDKYDYGIGKVAAPRVDRFALEAEKTKALQEQWKKEREAEGPPKEKMDINSLIKNIAKDK